MTTTVAPFEVLRFEAAPVAGGIAVLELDGRFTGRPAARPHLLVESVTRRELAAVCVRFDPWAATFAVPLDVLEDAGTSFSLVPDRGPLIALPAPDLVAEGDGDRYVRMARTANELRHRLAGMVERTTSVEAELRDLDAALTTTVAERDDARARIELLESELYDVRTQLTDMTGRADVATTEVIETRTRAETAEARAVAAESELAALHARAEEVENELADALARAEAAEAQAYDLRGALETARDTTFDADVSRSDTNASNAGAGAETEAETVATEVIETVDDREGRLVWGAAPDAEPETDGAGTGVAPAPWWTTLEERIPESLTPARIAVGGALAVLFLWLVLIFLGLGPV